jgi:hypothetical protein
MLFALIFMVGAMASVVVALVLLMVASWLLKLEIKHKHGGFNINYEKTTVVWQQFGWFGL